MSDNQENQATVKMNSEVFSTSTIYVRKPLYALVEINTSQVETSLDGLRPTLVSISLVKKEFTTPIKQLFSRLIEQRPGGGKVSDVIQVTRAQVASIYVPLSRVKRAEDVAILIDVKLPRRI